MTASIQMMTHTQMGGGGGIFWRPQARWRLGCQHLHDRVPRDPVSRRGVVCHQGPRHIVPVELGQGFLEYMVHRHGFLCATPQVTISLGFQQSLGVW